jgi:hypothetical protein
MIDIEKTRTALAHAKVRMETLQREARSADDRKILRPKCDGIAREIESFDRLYPTKSVFLSYSTQPFVPIRDRRMSGKLQTTVAGKLGAKEFEVKEGFGGGERIVGNILRRLRESTIYVGILGPVVEVRLPESAEREKPTRRTAHAGTGGKRKRVFSPGSWVISEMGMALALGKPMVLFIHRQIDEQYFKLLGEWAQWDHPRFDVTNWGTRVEALVGSVEKQFHEVERNALRR